MTDPRPPALCLSRSDWDRQTAGHENRAEFFFLRALARGRRVIKLDRPFPLASLARPRSDKFRALRQALGPARLDPSSVAILRPLAWWLAEGDDRAWRLNPALYRPWLHRALTMAGEPPVLWIYDYRWWPLLSDIPRVASIYHCTEDYPALIGTAYGDDVVRWVRTQEDRLLERADLVFAVSPGLADTLRPRRPDVGVLLNSVDLGLYRPDAPCVADCAEIARLPRPIFGYIGELSFKVDYRLLSALADRHPGGSIVLIGRRNIATDDGSFAALEARPNVHFLGHRPPEALPALTAHFDVCIIPYIRDEWFVRAQQAVKTFEYLACARPVVSTWMPNLLPWKDTIAVCRSDLEFLEACDAAVVDPGGDEARERRLAAARANSWEARVAEADQGLEQFLAANNPPAGPRAGARARSTPRQPRSRRSGPADR